MNAYVLRLVIVSTGLSVGLGAACTPSSGTTVGNPGIGGGVVSGTGGGSVSGTGGNTSSGSGGAASGGTGGGTTSGTGGKATTGGTGGTRAGTGGSASTGSGGGGVPGTGGATTTGSTGGAAPATSGTPLIGGVAFSTPSQSFKAQLAVSMTTAIAGAEIRYTVDGTLPTATSKLSAGTALIVTATTQLRAQAFVAGTASGLVSTAIYIARTFDLTSKLPIVIVDGYGKGQPTDKNVYKDAAVMIFEPVGGSASLTSLPTIATRAGYHIRGQSSASFPQKPYKLELWDNANADSKYAVLGMPADADWALIAPYYDRALIRNPFVYTLGKDMGMEAPRAQYAEVYVNYAARALGDADYQGIYWLTETIKNSGHRTNLKELETTDTTLPAISGGYIFKFDQAAAEEPKLVCTGSNPISTGIGTGSGAKGTCWSDLEVVDPDPLGAEQKAWLTTYIQTFHNALHATPIGDYAASIDVPSFVDYLIVNEVTRNVDAYVRSAYFFKDRDGKLKGGPLWDYNFALAVGGSTSIDPKGGWQYQGTRNINNWFPKLSGDAAFMAQVKTRYKALRTNLLSQASIDQRINMLIAPLDAAAVARDYAKWPVSTVLPGGHSGIVYGPSVATWDGQVQAMRDFITARLAWMDTQLQ
jgi:hypothetical protein